MQTLDYASTPNRRWSRQAFWSLAIALLGTPALIASTGLMAALGMTSRADGIYPFFLLILLPLFGLILGITSSIRIKSSHGQLRGLGVACTGALLSLAWPIALVALIVSIGSIC